MTQYPVTGLIDDETHLLYVSGVFEGHHSAKDLASNEVVFGTSYLIRYTGWIDAAGPVEAEATARHDVANPEDQA